MMKKRFNKYLLAIGAILLVLAIVAPSVAAYEGYLIDIKVHVKGDIKPTRTPGYWSTHLEAATYVFEDVYGEYIDLGWPEPITNMADLEAIFWASNSKESCGNSCNRSPICKSKFKCAFQALAAVLTAGTPNGAPLPVSIEDIRATLSRTDADAKEAIDNLQALLDNFNNSNDLDCLALGLPGVMENNATPQAAQDMANIPFADCD